MPNYYCRSIRYPIYVKASLGLQNEVRFFFILRENKSSRFPSKKNDFSIEQEWKTSVHSLYVDRQENGNGLWLIWIFTKLFKRAGSSFTKNSSSKLIDHLTNNNDNNNILAVGVEKVKLFNHKIRLIGSCRLICVKPLWSKQQKVDPKRKWRLRYNLLQDRPQLLGNFVCGTNNVVFRSSIISVFKTRWFIAGSFSRL